MNEQDTARLQELRKWDAEERDKERSIKEKRRELNQLQRREDGSFDWWMGLTLCLVAVISYFGTYPDHVRYVPDWGIILFAGCGVVWLIASLILFVIPDLLC